MSNKNYLNFHFNCHIFKNVLFKFSFSEEKYKFKWELHLKPREKNEL